MPTFSDSHGPHDSHGLNKNGGRDFSSTERQELADIELRDFSDDIDLEGLGALLGNDNSQNFVKPEQEAATGTEQKKTGLRDSFRALFGAISNKIKVKKKDNLPPESEDVSGYDFTYKPYTDDDIARDNTEDSALTNSQPREPSPFEDSSPFDQASPFENSSPFDQASPLEDSSPFDQASPFEDSSPFDQASPFEDSSPFDQTPPFEEPSPIGINTGENYASQSDGAELKDDMSIGVPDNVREQTFGQKFADLEHDTVEEMQNATGKSQKESRTVSGFSALFANLSKIFKSAKKNQKAPLPSAVENTTDNFGDISDTVRPINTDDLSHQPDENQLGGYKFDDFSNQFSQSEEKNEEDQCEFTQPVEFPTEQSEIPENTVEVEADLGGQQISRDNLERRRTYDIVGAIRAMLARYGKRLPSFKPKVYTIPESTYEPIDDNIKSPSLIADIEEYIRKESDFGDLQIEYDDMRNYISSMSTDAKLTSEEIIPPKNIREVHAAESELFSLIDQISSRNEQQRRQIGVYAASEEDPYSYRGINNDRQNYIDIDASSFSIRPSISFESEQKIDPNRDDVERRYYDGLNQAQSGNGLSSDFVVNQFDDVGAFNDIGRQGEQNALNGGFSDSFDSDFNSLGGQGFSYSPEYGEYKRGDQDSSERIEISDAPYDEFDGDLDDDFDDDYGDQRGTRRGGSNREYRDSRERTRSVGNVRGASYDEFDNELADDFDSNFVSPRVSVRSTDRKPKKVTVRRRG